MAFPRLADIQCRKLRFQAGDKLLVRTTHRLEPYEEKRLRQSIQRWAGVEVCIFVYSIADMNITVESLS